MILGYYKYKTYSYASGRPVLTGSHCLRVEVLRATLRKYHVRYLGFHANGSAVNSLHWVKQEKVQLDDPAAEIPRQEIDPVTSQPRPVREIRLPYKDNDDDNLQ